MWDNKTKKWKTVGNEAINEMEEVAGNMFKHQFRNESSYQLFCYLWLWDNDCRNRWLIKTWKIKEK